MNFEFLELTELRKLLDEKKVSSVELAKYFLGRIKKYQDLNAFITVTEEEAELQAKVADDYIASPGENPFLCGIPYAAKDMFLTKGIRTTAASKILDNYVPPFDSTIIAKLKEQKAVLLGKTNQDQFAHGSSGESSAYGFTLNPWDKTRMPAGSSSGSGAGVSAGLAPYALGTDTGGSIRGPASFCGVTGYKPTYGRTSRYGVISMASSMDTQGFLCLSVEDAAHIAEYISGHDPKDASTGALEVPEYHKNLQADLNGLKVGLPKEYFLEGMEPGVEKRVQEAIKQIEKLGATIVEVSLPSTHYGQMVYAIITPSEISSNLAKYDGIRFGHSTAEAKDLLEVYNKSRAEGFGDEAKRRIMTGTYVLSAGYYDAYYKRAQKIRRLLVNEFEQVFKQVDVLLTPTSPNVALKSGLAQHDPIYAYIADRLLVNCNLAGIPAISVPCGFALPADGETPSADGLPVGLQIIGPQWGEQKIFNVGYAYQQATDWHKKHPSI
ncbi:MAG: Asp-tRNA(Asn)/Glu-tRNA(Gln) amidotransferase subunit GatA [Patescibacteria group bacterium]|nr:Asp-tRNA(Asn)/Glu-tRNA(Gln) amidotransferase subunit GatA [Patescibacteria group bacterium]